MQTTKAVKNPKKQRKQLFNAPAHQRHKLMAARLSPDQIASKGVKTLPVRKGDTVRVMRGDHQGFEGKVSRVDLHNYRVYVEGLTREKVDGTTIFVSVHPSKVMIKNLNLDDKWRKAAVERKQAIAKEEEKKEVKKVPAKAPAAVAKPAEKPAKAVKAEAKAKAPAKIKEEKPAEAPPKPVEAKAKAPAKVKEEKPVEKVIPVEVAKPAEAEAKVPEKAEVEKKPVKRKRAVTAAKKPAAATAEKKEVKPMEEEKKPKAPAKKATVKKAPVAKSKAKAEKEGGT